jgi:hypothetical protein
VGDVIDLDAERKKRAPVSAAVVVVLAVAFIAFAWALDE